MQKKKPDIRRVSSKIVHANPWYLIRQDKVVWPQGSKADYFVLRTNGKGSVITIAEKSNAILLLEQFRYPSGQRSIEFPGGMVPKKEPVMHCAQRELSEETGYRAKKITLIGTILLNSTLSDYPMYITAASGITKIGKPRPENNELPFRAFWVSRSALNGLIRRRRIRDAASLAAWSCYTASKVR